MAAVLPWILLGFGALLSAILALITWALLKLVDHERQLYRLVADRESEKGTMGRIHNDFEQRLRGLERGQRGEK